MEIQSELKKILASLEYERKALFRTTFVLARKRDNIPRYLELVTLPNAHSNAPKRRAQKLLRPIKEQSIELFVLCALATNQRMLGTVKWTRDEIDVVLQWWARVDQPLVTLQGIQQKATAASHKSTKDMNELPSNIDKTSNESSLPVANFESAGSSKNITTDHDRILIKAAWLIEALQGKESITLVMNRSRTQTTSVELPQAIDNDIFNRLSACSRD